MSGDRGPGRRAGKGLIQRALAHPNKILPGVIRSIWPQSNVGTDWVRIGQYISFKERGFVAASSPSALLARHNYEIEIIDRLLSGRPISRSLEVGCGYGRLSPVIAKHSESHVAIDINPKSLALARTTYPEIAFRQASITQLPFPSDSFPAVITWTVLQHIPPPDIDRAMLELQRVLAPGGLILMCEATKYPRTTNAHVWDRDPDYYAAHLAGMTLKHSSYIDILDQLPDNASPGRVMLFESDR